MISLLPAYYNERLKGIKVGNLKMATDEYSNAGLQRFFQKGGNNFVLIHKNGKAVSFQLDHSGNVNIVDRQTDGKGLAFKKGYN